MANINCAIAKVLIACVILLQHIGYAEAIEGCGIRRDLLDHVNVVNKFELNQAFKSGFEAQFCVGGTRATISRVGKIQYSQNVAYVVKQQVCAAAIEVGVTATSSLDLLSKLEFDCEVSHRRSYMCLRSKNSCTFKDISNFVPTNHINVSQFGSIAHTLNKIATMDTQDGLEKFTLLSEKSIDNLKKINKSDDRLRLLVLEFNDYSSFVYPGKIDVIARQGQILFDFIFGLDANGPVLEEVSISVE